MTANADFRSFCCVLQVVIVDMRMSAEGHQRKYSARAQRVRFSNRPFGVKRFQTIHHCSVDVAHGLALLFGIGTKALPSWDPRTRWNNLMGGLAVKVTG